jgi:hypothetical protein
MRSLRLVVAGTVMLALLAAMGVSSVASDDAAPDPAVVVEGTDSCYRSVTGDDTIEPGGILRSHGYGYECTVDTNDARFGGVFMTMLNEDCYLTTDGSVECILYGTNTTAAAGGGWDCTWAGSGDPSGANYVVAVQTCAGTGDNAGLAYVGHRTFPTDAIDDTSHRGVIYEGEPPSLLAE